jgi:hypothetical protein
VYNQKEDALKEIMKCIVGVGALFLLMFNNAMADEQNTQDLAKASQNPIANLISLPFQNNTNFGIGPEDDVQNILNIQPVWPFALNEKWNVITRTIIPLMWQPDRGSGPWGMDSEVTFGLGDTTFTAFFSPSEDRETTWGIGPIFLLPTATDEVLGADKWGAGASVVVLTMPGQWVIGTLFSNVWSFAGSGDQDVNFFTFQYFINYNFDDGWYLTSAPIITANWEAPSEERWTVPFGAGFGKVFRIGKQPINASAHAYYNVEKPTNGPDWQLRLQMNFLFPK